MKPVAMPQHAVLLSVLVMMLVLATNAASAPRKSSQDQYQRDDQAQIESDEHKPLHRVQLSSTGVHRFGLLPAGSNSQPDKPEELQVGCGDGSVKVPKPDAEIQVINKKREKRQAENPREKRDHIRWFGSATSQYNPPIQSVHVHGIQAAPGSPWASNNYQQRYPSYQIVIPLFGNPRTVPILFPAKPILFNPGYPLDNRPRPMQPTPPRETMTEAPGEGDTSPAMELGERFGGPADENDHPSWGIVESGEDFGGSSATTTTARPPVAGQPTKPPTPPLFHRPSHGEEGAGNIPSQNRPNYNDNPLELQSIVPTTQTPATTTTKAPERQLNRCVWSIISCCNPTNTQIRYNCFENLGCPGAFWDRNPCSREVTLAALNAAQEFYEQT